MVNIILGITGPNCAGKDTVAEYLISKGFIHYSLSDAIRDELRKRNMPITRDNLITFATQMREMMGNAIFAEKTFLKLEDGKNYVISSIRHPDEVAILQKRKEFHLVDVDAPLNMRFERMKARPKGERDPQTLADFKVVEDREKGQTSSAQDVPAVRRLAKYVILNDKDHESLHKKIEKLLKDLGKRPDWDEYFMDVMRAVSKRSTCDRGRTSSIIVKDKRILTTGYAGAPVGVAHCDDVGHLMHEVTDESGEKHMHCVRTAHAEQNALMQAARYGIPIDGATVYLNMEPCFNCAKLVINAGIKRVVCNKKYHGARLSRQILQEAGVHLDVLHDELEQYTNQKIR